MATAGRNVSRKIQKSGFFRFSFFSVFPENLFFQGGGVTQICTEIVIKSVKTVKQRNQLEILLRVPSS